MNIWENAVLTNKGINLQAKLIKGSTLTISKVLTGAGKVLLGMLQAQTEISDPKQVVKMQEVKPIEDGRAVVHVLLENTELDNSYTLWQLGFYANDPDEGEILYAIVQATEGKMIPSKTDMPGYSLQWNFTFQTGNASQLEVTVDYAGLATLSEVDNKIIAAQKVVDDKIANIKTVSITEDGLMDKSDKKKLDEIEEFANHYIHPENHQASIIQTTDFNGEQTSQQDLNVTIMDKLELKAEKEEIPKIVNDLASDSTQMGLAAAQGKVLDGKIEALNDNLGEVGSRFQTGRLSEFGITDFNKCTINGIYRFESSELNRPKDVNFSQLLVIHSPTTDTIAQIVVCYSNAKMYIRSGNPADVNGGGNWTEWKLISTINDLPKLLFTTVNPNGKNYVNINRPQELKSVASVINCGVGGNEHFITGFSLESQTIFVQFDSAFSTNINIQILYFTI